MNRVSPTGPLVPQGLGPLSVKSPFVPPRLKVERDHVDRTPVGAECATGIELVEHVLVALDVRLTLVGVQREVEERNAAAAAVGHPNQVVGDDPIGHDAAVVVVARSEIRVGGRRDGRG